MVVVLWPVGLLRHQAGVGAALSSDRTRCRSNTSLALVSSLPFLSLSYFPGSESCYPFLHINLLSRKFYLHLSSVRVNCSFSQSKSILSGGKEVVFPEPCLHSEDSPRAPAGVERAGLLPLRC